MADDPRSAPVHVAGEAEAPSPEVDLLGIAVGPPPAPVGLFAARVDAFDEAARTVRLLLGSRAVTATLDPPLDPLVIRTALERQERVIAQAEGNGFVVLGALRTSATPGVDAIDDITLRAKRVAIEGQHEVRITSGSASFVMRARGYIESVATDITSRASSLHKIVGRMIRLN